MPVLRRETAALPENHERAILLHAAQETVLAGAGAAWGGASAPDARFSTRVSSAGRRAGDSGDSSAGAAAERFDCVSFGAGGIPIAALYSGRSERVRIGAAAACTAMGSADRG